jgi:hypothetical protein
MKILSLAVKPVGDLSYAVGAVLRDGRGWKDTLSIFGGYVRIDTRPLKPGSTEYISSVIHGIKGCKPWEEFALKVLCKTQKELNLAFYDWFRPASKDALVVVDGGSEEREFLSRCAMDYSRTREVPPGYWTGYVLVDFQLQELANILLTSGFRPESNRLEMAKPHMHFADERFANNPLWRAHVIAWCATEAFHHRPRTLQWCPEFPEREQFKLDLNL